MKESYLLAVLVETIRREYPGCAVLDTPHRLYIDVYSRTLTNIDGRPLSLPEAIRKRPFQQLVLWIEAGRVILRELGIEDDHLPEDEIGSPSDPDFLQRLRQAIVAYCDQMQFRYWVIGVAVTYDLLAAPLSFGSLPVDAKKQHPEPTMEVSNG